MNENRQLSTFISEDNNYSDFVHKPCKNNSRQNKGNEVLQFVEDYCILDLETTDIFLDRAEIIEIAIVKVRNNDVIDKYASLVCPSCDIPKQASIVNNITNDMVKDAPMLEEIIDEVLDFIGDDIIVGHNIKRFDINLFYDKTLMLRNKFFTNDFIDTLEMANRSNVPTCNNKLSTLSVHFGQSTEGEHRALKDCMLNKVVYEKLWENYRESCFCGRHRSSNTVNNNSSFVKPLYSDKTMAIRQLNDIVGKIVEDGEVAVCEVEQLNEWIESHKELSAEYPCNKIIDILQDIFEDGLISDEETDDIKALLLEILDPVAAQSVNDNVDCVEGKHICLTGDFEFGARSLVEKLLVEKGAIIDKTVKKATNLLVVGGHGSSAWTSGNYGSKVKKAIEFNDKYKDSVKIIIAREDAILHLLND